MNKREYKKLRSLGLKASMAKSMASHRLASYAQKLSVLPNGIVSIRRNGLNYIFSMDADDDGQVFVDDLGEFTDDYQEDAIPHDQNNPHTFNWFVPSNIASVEELISLGMDKHSADCERRRQIQQNYKLVKTYGDNWLYYDLVGRVYIDDPVLFNVCLHTNVIGGIAITFGKSCNIYELDELIKEQIQDLKENATKIVHRMYTRCYKDKEINELMEQLSNYGATFLALYDQVGDIDTDLIEKWVESTRGEHEFDCFLPEGYSLDKWLDKILDHKDDIVAYLQ